MPHHQFVTPKLGDEGVWELRGGHEVTCPHVDRREVNGGF